MKKLMLSTAVAAFAFVVTPAMAQDDSGVKLNVGGHFKGYMSYVSQDDDFAEVRDFDILRETEVHFGGETTLDNGLTVGAQIEAETDSGDGFEIDESYLYMAGSWGRVNFGDEDGAAYLLQVAAPSADDNVDGLRQFINPFNYTAALGADLLGFNTGGFDYDNDFAGDDDKVTYLSPVFNGFQAGVSYTPESLDDSSDGVTGNNVETDGNVGSTWEVAARYEGTFNTVGVILGAGYTHADIEEDELVGQDDFNEWNVGADFDIGAFGVGVVYTENNNTSDVNDENETWVAGVDYTTGPFKLGASYLNNQTDVLGTDVDSDRWAAGVVYTYGPGMTFRGSVQHVNHDIDGIADGDGTAVLLGTQVNF